MRHIYQNISVAAGRLDGPDGQPQCRLELLILRAVFQIPFPMCGKYNLRESGGSGAFDVVEDSRIERQCVAT